MDSDIVEPLNLGCDELVTINQLVDIVEDIAGIKLERNYDLDGPAGRARPQQRQHADQGAAGLGAADPLEDGLEKTYHWIHDQITTRRAVV